MSREQHPWSQRTLLLQIGFGLMKAFVENPALENKKLMIYVLGFCCIFRNQ